MYWKGSQQIQWLEANRTRTISRGFLFFSTQLLFFFNFKINPVKLAKSEWLLIQVGWHCIVLFTGLYFFRAFHY